MFTIPCFIRKNTKEIRNKLEKIGYSKNKFNGLNDCILTSPVSNSFYEVPVSCLDDKNPHSSWGLCRIDCGTNEELFFAIAALRDDSDIFQYFVIDDYVGIEELPNNFIGSLILCEKENHEEVFKDFEVHKACIEELFEYIKN